MRLYTTISCPLPKEYEGMEASKIKELMEEGNKDESFVVEKLQVADFDLGDERKCKSCKMINADCGGCLIDEKGKQVGWKPRIISEV